MSYQQKQAAALKCYRQPKWEAKVDVKALRIKLFGENRVPNEVSNSPFRNVPLVNEKGFIIAITDVFVIQFGTAKRGGRGHRMFIYCPLCNTRMPVGRLHQHYGYKHPDPPNPATQPHIFKNSNNKEFDSDCSICGGKLRDSIHGATDEIREASQQ